MPLAHRKSANLGKLFPSIPVEGMALKMFCYASNRLFFSACYRSLYVT